MLNWNVMLPDDAVTVRVSKGWVTLEGQLGWEYQRRAAEADVRKLSGVVGVTNQITLKARVQPADVSRRIEAALKRDVELEAGQVRISGLDGKVTLDGNVHSWRERAFLPSPSVRASAPPHR